MKKLLAFSVLALCLAPTAYAQSGSTLLVTPPASSDGPRDYCLYAGLAYSQDALLTVDVPYRRESPQAVQKRLLKCTLAEDGENLRWEDFDIENRGTQGN